MKRVRIFARVPPARWAPGETLALQPDQVHYLSKVLRLGQGDEIAVSDGAGQRWQARIQDTKVTLAELVAPVPATAESPLYMTLLQAISSAEKMDWSIEKSVELGVNTVIAVQSQRSVVKLNETSRAKKQAHWQAIIEAAALQSGRDNLPVLIGPNPLPTVLQSMQEAPGVKLVLHPDGKTTLNELDPAIQRVALAVGPESGWAPQELALFQQFGWLEIGLGPRILRSETAGPAGLAALQVIYGDYCHRPGLHSKF